VVHSVYKYTGQVVMGVFGSGLLGNTIRKMQQHKRRLNAAAGISPAMRAQRVAVVRNRNTPGPPIVRTSPAVAAAQRAAIRKRIDARINKYRRRHKMGGLRAVTGRVVSIQVK